MNRWLILVNLLILGVIFKCTNLLAEEPTHSEKTPGTKQEEISDHRFPVPSKWAQLRPILIARVDQKEAKMKLTPEEVQGLITFLNTLSKPTPKLLNLQKVLPKTTIELLRSVVSSRNVPLAEAEKMAEYLDKLVKDFDFQNTPPFDENTSHIIGREWSEIDYSGEGMTWEKQRSEYMPYGVVNFKSVDTLMRFFAVESKLPYFQKIYKPRKPKGPFA